MLKKIFKLMLVFTFISFSFTNSVYATENEEKNQIDEFVEVNDSTLFNKKEFSYYFFDNNDELNKFITAINEENGISSYACLPGDPGYPGCNSDPVVSITTKTISSEIIGYKQSNNYMLGKNGWMKGPGFCD